MTSEPAGRGCGCPDTPVRTPRGVSNRPALSQISYRSGTHGDFLASMLAGLSSAERPALAALRTRDGDDPTVALLDAWAVVCDVLTFYTERLESEAFLRTATEPASLRELGNLVGYRIDPGVAAETHLAFTLERPPALSTALPPDPGLVPPTVPVAVRLPCGLRVQSIPCPGEQPQVFETAADVEARPEWNALPVARTTPHPLGWGHRDAWLAGTALNLRRGDTLLLAGTDLLHDRWDLRLLSGVDVDIAGGRTHVWWQPGLGSVHPFNEPATAAEAFVLRKRIPVFGHQAPVWLAMTRGFRDGYRKVYGGTAEQPEWPNYTAVTVVTDNGARSVVSVDLDGSHPEVVAGSRVVISEEGDRFYRELYRVTAAARLSRSEFGVSGTVTRLTLEGEAYAFGSPRAVTVLAVADKLDPVGAPDTSDVTGATVLVDGDATAMRAGRTVILAGLTTAGVPGAEVLTVASVTAARGGRTLVTLKSGPGTPYQRQTAVLYGNVARATHGETVRQVLGDGDPRRGFQSFSLLHAPLTRVPAATVGGSTSTLVVSVDGAAWDEKPTLYGTGPADRVFVTRTGPDGTPLVGFGDGVTGTRPPSGSQNVRATYRKGLGRAGNVAAGAIALPLDRPLGLKAVTNPVAATGGTDPQDDTAARRSIPLPVRTLGRAVSLRDYADFALAFTGVSLADAALLTLRAGRTIVVTVAGPGGEPPVPATVSRLAGALREQGDPHVRVEVLPYRPASFRLAVKVRVAGRHDPAAVLPGVGSALRSGYAATARELAAPVYRSAVIAAIAGVPGVAAVDLDRLYRTAGPVSTSRGPGGGADRLVAAPASADGAGRALAAELLTLADAPFDWLVEMP